MSNNTFTIAATQEEILTSIGEHAALHTATGWRLAAELAAIVRLADGPGGDQRSTIAKNRNGLSTIDITKLNLRGLTNHETVTRYVKGWLDTHKGVYPEPGETVIIPEGPFPPRDANSGSRVAADPVAAVEQLIRKHGAEKVTAIVVERAARTRLAPSPDPGRITDRGKSTEELAEEAFWQKVRGALGVLVEAIPRIDAAPADVALMFQIIRPAGDWDEALDDLISR